ncbi:MAG: LuxR C-terminal-related transcriptional regulator [Spirochaetota bacterium]
MNQFALWFDIVSFALMSAAAGLTYIVYSRNRAAWLRDYLVYSMSYGFWALFAGWVFFQQVYLSAPIPAMTALFAFVRAGISVVIAWFGAVFLLRIDGTLPEHRLRLYVGIAVLALVAAMTPIMLFRLPVLGSVVSVSFNIAFAILSWRAYLLVRRARTSPARPILPILLYSAVGYTMLTMISLGITRLLPPENLISINVLAGGAFVFVWAVIAIVVFGRWIGGREAASSVPDSFLGDYQITRREAEILRVLILGRTAGQIGETLFISQRTVEAHLRNIYRKCGVGNRVELVAKIAGYRG